MSLASQPGPQKHHSSSNTSEETSRPQSRQSGTASEGAESWQESLISTPASSFVLSGMDASFLSHFSHHQNAPEDSRGLPSSDGTVHDDGDQSNSSFATVAPALSASTHSSTHVSATSNTNTPPEYDVNSHETTNTHNYNAHSDHIHSKMPSSSILVMPTIDFEHNEVAKSSNPPSSLHSLSFASDTEESSWPDPSKIRVMIVGGTAANRADVALALTHLHYSGDEIPFQIIDEPPKEELSIRFERINELLHDDIPFEYTSLLNHLLERFTDYLSVADVCLTLDPDLTAMWKHYVNVLSIPSPFTNNDGTPVWDDVATTFQLHLPSLDNANSQALYDLKSNSGYSTESPPVISSSASSVTGLSNLTGLISSSEPSSTAVNDETSKSDKLLRELQAYLQAILGQSGAAKQLQRATIERFLIWKDEKRHASKARYHSYKTNSSWYSCSSEGVDDDNIVHFSVGDVTDPLSFRNLLRLSLSLGAALLQRLHASLRQVDAHEDNSEHEINDAGSSAGSSTTISTLPSWGTLISLGLGLGFGIIAGMSLTT